MDFGALERGAIVGEDETGGGAVDADFYSQAEVSIIVSSRQRVGVVRQISCGSILIPKRKTQLHNIRTVRIRR